MRTIWLNFYNTQILSSRKTRIKTADGTLLEWEEQPAQILSSRKTRIKTLPLAMKEREDVPQILSSRKTRIKTTLPQTSPQVKYNSDTILQKNKD